MFFLAGGLVSALAEDQSDFFEQKVRPLLVERCFKCHSHSSEKLKGGLFLDSLEGVLKGGDSGPAVVPGDVEKSMLIKAVRYSDPDLQMPPKSKLTDGEIRVLEEWVRTGALFPASANAPSSGVKNKGSDLAGRATHWAFAPVTRPHVPAVRDAAWIRNPIDAFVLDGLERAGLAPAPPADRATWLRRVTFDLTGLPPTPEEVRAFLNDDSPGAEPKVVDRLLASPQYGERWGRHWLDVARFAESSGADIPIPYTNAWRFRDYVIQAFNQDKPYDQFVREQIAGDLLPASSESERYEHLTATGFLVIGPKMLVEQDKQKLLMDVIDEEIDTLGKAFLGLTTGCARCHDHKYDPIPTRDYYALAGILRSTKSFENLGRTSKWNERPLATPEEVEAYAAHRKKIADKKAEAAEMRMSANEKLRDQWRQDFARYLLAATEWIRSHPASPPGAEGAMPVDPEEVQGMARRAKIDARVLAQWIRYLNEPGRMKDPVFGLWFEYVQLAEQETFAREGSRAVAELEERIRSGKLKSNPLIAGLLNGDPPLSREALASRYQGAAESVIQAWKALRAEKKNDSNLKLGNLAQEMIRNVLSGEKGPFAIATNSFEFYDPGTRAALDALQSQVSALEKSCPPPVSYAMAVEESSITNIPVHIRGSHLQLSREPVPRGTLSCFKDFQPPPVPAEQSGRLQLANWMTDTRNPLTARVMVNRVWQWHFGEGLVPTPNNFGFKGEPPSHPALLDWLASEFMRQGWSIKRIHRLILLSSTYRMSSKFSESGAKRDPSNRLVWRVNPRRLEVEAIRDALLSVGGNLDLRLEGAHPDRINNFITAGDPTKNEARYAKPQRAVYLPVIRFALYDMFSIFDFADPTQSVGRRPSTIDSHQALFMMNSPFVQQAAAHFAKTLETEPGETERVRLAYWKAFGRAASSSEVSAALDAIHAWEKTGGFPPGEKREKAWQLFCQSLFASNEFIVIE